MRQVVSQAANIAQPKRIFIKLLACHVKDLERIIPIYTRREKLNEMNLHNLLGQQQTEIRGQVVATKPDKTERKL